MRSFCPAFTQKPTLSSTCPQGASPEMNVDECLAGALRFRPGMGSLNYLKHIYTIERQVTAAQEELHLTAGWSKITLVAPKFLIAGFNRRMPAAVAKLFRWYRSVATVGR